MVDANQDAANLYCIANKTNAIPKEIYKTFPFADKVDNDLKAKIEEYEFVKFPPEKYFLYVDFEKKIVTTFTGVKLGHIVWANRPYYSNFGDKRIGIDVYGINGKKYHGTYYVGAGDYARIKMYKNQ